MIELNNVLLKEILRKESGTGKSGKEWQRQTFVVEIGGQYPKTIAADLWNDKVDWLGASKEGDMVSVKLDVDSSSFNGKYFTNVRCFNFKNHSETTGAKQHNTPTQKVSENIKSEEKEEGLPF